MQLSAKFVIFEDALGQATQNPEVTESSRKTHANIRSTEVIGMQERQKVRYARRAIRNTDHRALISNQ